MKYSIEEALKALAAGRPILVADNEDRENEGDFIVAAEAATPEIVNLLITEGRGLVCAALPPSRAQDLSLECRPTLSGPPALHGTAFTESVDYIHGTTTGISTADRSATLKALADPKARGDDFARPGHVFPLLSEEGGVLTRPGHTEATVDLCRLAGFSGVGVLCEILNPDGSMARRPDLERLARRLDLVLVTVEQLIFWRQSHEGAKA
jgi:3,4-dihydroxy 2-butanone 4-phosphate synthase/GTP cyclohydrolase II